MGHAAARLICPGLTRRRVTPNQMDDSTPSPRPAYQWPPRLSASTQPHQHELACAHPPQCIHWFGRAHVQSCQCVCVSPQVNVGLRAWERGESLGSIDFQRNLWLGGKFKSPKGWFNAWTDPAMGACVCVTRFAKAVLIRREVPRRDSSYVLRVPVFEGISISTMCQLEGLGSWLAR